MIEVKFNYNGEISSIKCNENERLKDVFKKISFKNKSNSELLYFLYNNDKINDVLSINQFITANDKQKGKMKIIVKKNQEISCPKCGRSIKLKIKDYKIMLYDCKNEHKFNKILLDEFAKTQNFKEPDIQCKNCKDKNNNEQIYYKCYKCKINLCHSCYSIHNQTHKIINCDKSNYVCSIHGDKLCSFCKTCKLNICNLCKNKHNLHEVEDFSSIIPNKEIIIKNKAELKKNIELFHNNINDIINILNKIFQNIEQYYQIYNNIINNFENDEINYEILNNLNEIISNTSIQKDLNVINKQNNIKHKFNNMMKMYDKMSNKNIEENNEIALNYKVNEKDNFIKIFDSTFVNNNKKWCKINYANKEYNLSSNLNTKEINLNFYNNEIELKLTNIKKITDMSHIFDNCTSLISLPDIDLWDTSKITNMSYNIFNQI